MTDETDIYLGRCLKNWAQREKSHARSKESLLRIAAAQPKIDQHASSAFGHGSCDEFRNYRQSMIYSRMYMRGSCTMSLGWTVDLSTLLRLAQ